MSFGKRKEYKIVGYVSKSGRLGTYKQVARTPDKFNEGKFRVCLESFGDEPVKFWVDEEKLCDPPPPKKRHNDCDCEDTCCARYCSCEEWCNCKGGNIYDC